MTDLSITLAGKSYVIKPLVWRQLRVILPAFARLRTAGLDHAFTEEAMDAQAVIVHAALDNGMSYEDFINLAITQDEMFVALPIIAAQGGLKKGDGAQGEAQTPVVSST